LLKDKAGGLDGRRDQKRDLTKHHNGIEEGERRAWQIKTSKHSKTRKRSTVFDEEDAKRTVEWFCRKQSLRNQKEAGKKLGRETKEFKQN